MKQGEHKIIALGDSVATLFEKSNDTKKAKYPELTVLIPERDWGDNHEFSSPAKSMKLYNKEVVNLYSLLKQYFESNE